MKALFNGKPGNLDDVTMLSVAEKEELDLLLTGKFLRKHFQ
jgi:hypothetical protein